MRFKKKKKKGKGKKINNTCFISAYHDTYFFLSFWYISGRTSSTHIRLQAVGYHQVPVPVPVPVPDPLLDHSRLPYHQIIILCNVICIFFIYILNYLEWNTNQRLHRIYFIHSDSSLAKVRTHQFVIIKTTWASLCKLLYQWTHDMPADPATIEDWWDIYKLSMYGSYLPYVMKIVLPHSFLLFFFFFFIAIIGKSYSLHILTKLYISKRRRRNCHLLVKNFRHRILHKTIKLLGLWNYFLKERFIQADRRSALIYQQRKQKTDLLPFLEMKKN